LRASWLARRPRGRGPPGRRGERRYAAGCATCITTDQAFKVGRAGLEPATNGFASGGSRRCRMMPVMLCGSTTLVRTAFLARTVFSHRIPFILAE